MGSGRSVVRWFAWSVAVQRNGLTDKKLEETLKSGQTSLLRFATIGCAGSGATASSTASEHELTIDSNQ